MRIDIPIVPPSTNNAYPSNAQGRRYLSPVGLAFKESLGILAKTKWRSEPSKRPIMVKIVLQFPDKKRRDIDNFSKLLLDSMKDIVFRDDSQIVDLHLTKMIGKEARTILDIQEI